MLGRKKEVESSPQQPQARTAAAPASPPAWSQPSARAEARAEAPARSQMHIGRSVHIKGELSANEEMTIDGAVDGKIVIESHQLTIGAQGRITAEVRVKSIVVHGKVVGNITAEEKCEVKQGGTVEGDIHSPRVVLADGSQFKGNIEMGASGGRATAAPVDRQRTETKAAEPVAAVERGSVGLDVDDFAAPFDQGSDDAARQETVAVRATGADRFKGA